jgi:hypothetical protein
MARFVDRFMIAGPIVVFKKLYQPHFSHQSNQTQCMHYDFRSDFSGLFWVSSASRLAST